MHIRQADRARAFRKMVTLLKPGGLVMLSLRHGPGEPGREMFPVSLGEVEALARDHGLTVVRVIQRADVLARPDVSWTTMVCLRLPDDGTAGLSLIRGVILNDDKASTYKLGLLRAIAKIADNTPSMAETTLDTDRVEVPLGLVALNWVRMYVPLVAAGLPQAPSNSGPDGLGFAKAGFRSLLDLSIAAQELRPGATFSNDRLATVVAAISEARNTIVSMPVRYITLPNSSRQLFEVEGRPRGGRSGPALNPELLRSWGNLSVPGPLWRTMQRMGAWIEPLLLAEWSRLTRNYAVRMGMEVPPGSVEARLVWSEPARDTALARAAAALLEAAGKPVVCTWSGAPLRLTNLDIDHALPWSAWPCGDLWNLLPASRKINQHQKRERIPSAAALARARQPIVDWWREAWISHPVLPKGSTQKLERPYLSKANSRSRRHLPDWSGDGCVCNKTSKLLSGRGS